MAVDGHLFPGRALIRAMGGAAYHALRPVAVAALTAISPAFARRRFREFGFGALLWTRPGMDADGAMALAEVCGMAVFVDGDMPLYPGFATSDKRRLLYRASVPERSSAGFSGVGRLSAALIRLIRLVLAC